MKAGDTIAQIRGEHAHAIRYSLQSSVITACGLRISHVHARPVHPQDKACANCARALEQEQEGTCTTS